mmetsp:Transcript_16811/g.25159  ORF Transcript_16811/g.25159 Transcript_16811/m.25159 type:complete len:340 (-) Transcript_16811:5-1024(-)|eukprot:CAMPEP_0203641060 /NCGR_PEP_ID=MMETSP0088-20131115/6385_1 /ASSEMBLY_ACC=CAM_ASM_001087 /TAXON_ID=426623 /ORGANISM="Chaetoceros affinis, Strain CCMP159" /LENGTH=339 /DNA_ID=CAMNT_0050496401 /DNA_START=65 /DNA_END=1084 /DNA_ORIENTATION=-
MFADKLLLQLLVLSSTAVQISGEQGIRRTSANVAGEYIAESGFYQSITLTGEKPLVESQSKYQNIKVVQSKYYGKVLVLDGVIQLTEKDGDSYNEMMVHPVMFSHRMPKRVLIIGGGDGYVLSEVLKHPEVEHVDHVDLDSAVIDVCRNHFPWGSAWDDPRVHLHFADGSKFLDETEDGFYQVIIQDSSDPFTWNDKGEKVELPSNTLYSKEHFRNIERSLSSDGIFNFQAETFNIESDLEGIVDWRKQAIDVGFENARYGSISISTYPTGQIGFLLCEKSVTSCSTPEEVNERYTSMLKNGRETSYYHPKLQQSSFDLPLWVEKRIYQNESKTISSEM